MPLHEMEFAILREYCKRKVENLEIWLRWIIDEEFTTLYGEHYFDQKDDNSQNLINSDIVRNAKKRKLAEPVRYNRLIDAILLEEAMSILCNPRYKRIFKGYFKEEFNSNIEFARNRMVKLVPIRHKLSHAHEISVRDAERIICYTSDLIDSFKAYYKEKNMQERYNAPTIIRVKDSLGNIFESTQIRRNGTGRGSCDTRASSVDIFSGDTLSVEIEVDPSFDKDSFGIHWIFDRSSNSNYSINHNKLVVSIEDIHIREDFTFYAIVTSNKSWHRCGDCDDSISIIYQILPTNWNLK